MANQHTGPLITQSSFDYLNTLKKNNNREWFNAHKALFQREQQIIETFADALLKDLHTHDEIETPSGKKSLFRIYRDTRFSQDKTPYKTYWLGKFTRATKSRRGGYYFQVEKDNSFIAGAFWGPSPEDLRRVRDDIAFDAAPLRKILKNKTFVSLFKELKGEQVKTAPKGYDAGHEAIDLLRYKQFIVMRRFPDKEVLSKGFLKEAHLTFKAMRPFLNYMSEVLNTDSNGMAR